jgi:hypothetical protein
MVFSILLLSGPIQPLDGCMERRRDSHRKVPAWFVGLAESNDTDLDLRPAMADQLATTLEDDSRHFDRCKSI